MTEQNTQPEQATPAKEYTFTLTFVEACRVVNAIKRQPMDTVEDLVRKLDSQYIAQKEVEDKLAAEEASKVAKTPTKAIRKRA